MCKPMAISLRDVTLLQLPKPGLSATWEELTVEVGRKRSVILKDVTGGAAAGHLTAVLGPSGSGKSTLLGCVSARFREVLRVAKGRVLYDGEPWSRSRHKRLVAFVEQEDALLRDLTCRQTLHFAAALRGAADPAFKAAETLTALGLDGCADQHIGGANVAREISGGQRRRVSIGHELLLDPSLVLLDEPTSGLDSYAATRIFRLLCDLKKGGRAVLATLHQPTDLMLLGFDRLHLLLEGEARYAGPADGAVAAFSQLRSRPAGQPAADFLLDVLCSGDAPEIKAAPEPVVRTGIDGGGDLVLPWTRQYAILLRRCYWAHRLDFVDPCFLANIGCVTALMAMLWAGTAARRPRTARSVNDAAGLLFLTPVYWGFQLMIMSLNTFPPDRDVVARERGAGLYSCSAFFLARTTIDTLTACLLSPLCSLVYYWAVGFRCKGVGVHVLALFLNGLAAHSAGLCIGAWVSDLSRAMTLQTVFMLTTMMCGGFYVTRVPIWISWLQRLSFTRYTYTVLAATEYRGASYECGDDRCSVGSLEVFDDIPLERGIADSLLNLVAFAVAFRVVAFFGVKRYTK